MSAQERFQEALGIAQEEAAEVIQALSKIRRLGTEFKPKNGDKTNAQLAQEEIYDLLVLLKYMEFETVVPLEYEMAKIVRLTKWSNLFVTEEDEHVN